MLKEIRISNLVLIEYTEITFQKGLNALTGETGSGKSAILGGLNLIFGERADTSMIRRGCDKGVVEAEFDIAALSDLKHLLEESGIEHDEGSPLIIKREISLTGKSRSFVNNQMAQIGLLKQISHFLCESVGQHANRRLINTEFHREIIDEYGELREITGKFSVGREKEKKLRNELDRLKNAESGRLREIEVCRMEMKEIEEANLKDGEDDELFSEYTVMSHSEELIDKAGELIEILSNETGGTIKRMNQAVGIFHRLETLDPTLKESADLVKSALLELKEASFSLERYVSKIDHDPKRIAMINERLTLIAFLKKKYGETIADILNYYSKTKIRLYELERSESTIDEIEKSLIIIENENNTLAAILTEKRTEAAKKLNSLIVQELRSLNMPKVDFFIEISKGTRTSFGDDKIEFFLIPNVGEKKVSIKECASGGELSRLTLAIHTLLAGKTGVSTLIFDEVDANIGGETAGKVGKKLKEIAKHHQVLCITHFPQVAHFADHHLQISKKENEGRTFTQVKCLDLSERGLELERMQGGKQAS